MKLNETYAGMAVYVNNLDHVKPERRSALRDMGAYENGLLYIDDVKDGKVFFHKDSDVMSLSLKEAACVDVNVL